MTDVELSKELLTVHHGERIAKIRASRHVSVAEREVTLADIEEGSELQKVNNDGGIIAVTLAGGQETLAVLITDTKKKVAKIAIESLLPDDRQQEEASTVRSVMEIAMRRVGVERVELNPDITNLPSNTIEHIGFVPHEDDTFTYMVA